MSDFPVLATEGFVLRELTEDDLDGISSIWGSPQVTEKMSSGPLSRDDSKQMLYVLRSLWKNDAGIRWGVEMDGTLIGTCGFHNINKGARRAELGYELDSCHWGKGYMARALVPAIDYAFKHFVRNGIKRIEALLNVDNDRSAGLLYKLGFQKEGTLRDYASTPRGLIDQNIFSLLQGEWHSRRSGGADK